MRARFLPALAAVAATLAPMRAGAQEVGQSPLELVQYWDSVYQAAYDLYQGARARFQSLDNDWNILNDQYVQLREGNLARANRFLGDELMPLSQLRTSAEGQVRSAQREWENVGDSFIDALDSYLEILNSSILGTPAGDSFNESIDLYDTWNERLEEVEGHLAPSRLRELEPMPDVVARDDDTAEDLERKASALENRARRDSVVVAGLEDRIASLRRRLERDRSTADLAARNRRFGDMTVPVEAVTERVGINVADSAAVGDAQTPEQRIEALEAYRDDMVLYVEQLLERAGELRAEAARRGM